QCIHNGFGLHRFGEELTGPEYAARYEKEVKEKGIAYLLNTIVLAITPEKMLTLMSAEGGVSHISAKAIVLAMGCRERSRGALNIPGARPAGIYTAGTAQRFVNIKGYMPGKDVVILGSGDIGLIMARRMTLEGARVRAVCELMPYSGGLNRNIVQCLQDFDIPLKLSHTVSKIHGKGRVKGVTVSRVDENLRPIEGESEYIPCDTLLLSCGLIPENELTKGAGIALDRITGGAVVNERRETALPGVFACGNVLHVHDLVDYVSEEAALAGAAAAAYVKGEETLAESCTLQAMGGIRYTVPQRISRNAGEVRVYFRVGRIMNNATITLRVGDRVLLQKKKRKMAPGEMECLVLPAEVVAALDDAAELCAEEVEA
ncbi:MAG: FAD-dependent oxidoreductase, partial [Clostridia bacterium]|nr:FAD-dependent oxidoreductase [Clostridia bacterium]